MTFSRIYTLFLFLTCTATALTGCKEDSDVNPATETGAVDIEMQNMVGNRPLVLNTGSYTTEAGDPFTVTTFNYYISNIKLQKADGGEFVQPESYYLVKQSDVASQKFTIPNVPVGDYTGITFTIGVDSTRNVSGAQQGALDPLGGMFWSWNTGYIFLKLEGTSTATSNGQLLMHVGGFKKPYDAVRVVAPSFNGQTMRVRTTHTPTVHYYANVLKLFTGVRLSDTGANSHMPGASSVAIANRYSAGLFTVDHIHAN